MVAEKLVLAYFHDIRKWRPHLLLLLTLFFSASASTSSDPFSRAHTWHGLHGHLFYFACPHGLRNKRGRNSDQPLQENLTTAGARDKIYEKTIQLDNVI